MSELGKVASLWRYPVKSMAGEELSEAFVGFAGLYGDRIYAFKQVDDPGGFPWLTAREQPAMLQHRPRFRDPARAAAPPNLASAQSLAPGVTPLYASLDELAVDIEGPDGSVKPIDDPVIAQAVCRGTGIESVRLVRSDRAITDCRPVSLFSLQSVEGLSGEHGSALDPRRFRANIYADLPGLNSYVETELVGKRLRIGDRTILFVLEPDPRCKMITLDPDTGISTPSILRPVAQNHGGHAGVYCAVLAEGVIRRGDTITLLDRDVPNTLHDRGG